MTTWISNLVGYQTPGVKSHYLLEFNLPTDVKLNPFSEIESHSGMKKKLKLIQNHDESHKENVMLNIQHNLFIM